MRVLMTMAVVSAGLMLGGCASPLRVPLTQEHKSAIAEVKAKVIIIQDEVIVSVQPSNVSAATGGGLIGAVIDSKITNSRVKASQATMGPFYAAIESFDYRAEFKDAAGPGLAGYPFQVTEITTTPRALRQADLDEWRTGLGPKQALMIVAPRYNLSMDFRSLDSEMFVTLWTVAGGNAPVQRSVVYYQSVPMGTGYADSVSKWSADNAAPFRAAMKEAIAEAMRLALLDVQTGERPAAKDSDLKDFDFYTGNAKGKVRGQPLARENGRVTVLGQDGKLYSLPVADAAATTAASAK